MNIILRQSLLSFLGIISIATAASAQSSIAGDRCFEEGAFRVISQGDINTRVSSSPSITLDAADTTGRTAVNNLLGFNIKSSVGDIVYCNIDNGIINGITVVSEASYKHWNLANGGVSTNIGGSSGGTFTIPGLRVDAGTQLTSTGGGTFTISGLRVDAGTQLTSTGKFRLPNLVVDAKTQLINVPWYGNGISITKDKVPGNFIWVVPTKITSVRVTGCSSGGGGGTTLALSHTPGGDGVCAQRIFTVFPGTTISYTVPIGGSRWWRAGGTCRGGMTGLADGHSVIFDGFSMATGGLRATGSVKAPNGSALWGTKAVPAGTAGLEGGKGGYGTVMGPFCSNGTSGQPGSIRIEY